MEQRRTTPDTAAESTTIPEPIVDVRTGIQEAYRRYRSMLGDTMEAERSRTEELYQTMRKLGIDPERDAVID